MEQEGDPEALEVQLPLSRVKRIAKADQEVVSISAEATWLLAAATVRNCLEVPCLVK